MPGWPRSRDRPWPGGTPGRSLHEPERRSIICSASRNPSRHTLIPCPRPRGRRPEHGVRSPVSRRGMRPVVADPPVVAPCHQCAPAPPGLPKLGCVPIYALSSPHSLIPPQPQLLTDPTENTQQLTQQLRALGLYAADTLGDGNCLFRALSDQLYGTPSYHSRLRQDICDWIAAHQSRYEPFVEDERGFDVHLQCMRQQGLSTPPLPCAVSTYIVL